MTSYRQDIDITLHLIRLKIDKDIYVTVLFCFYQKKSTADAHRIIYDTYGENVIVIRICANWFKRFKNS